MTDREAIDVLFNEWKCIDRNDGIHCDRKCESCDLVMDVGIIREAFNMAISALQAQDDGDCISRKAALDALIALTVYSNKRDLVKEADNHPNTWIEGVAECIDEIEDMPSAQLEIVRCKDCKHFRTYYHGTESDTVITHACVWFLDRTMGLEDYCSKGVFR